MASFPSITDGKLTRDNVGARKDLLTQFPSVGLPHKARPRGWWPHKQRSNTAGAGARSQVRSLANAPFYISLLASHARDLLRESVGLWNARIISLARPRSGATTRKPRERNIP